MITLHRVDPVIDDAKMLLDALVERISLPRLETPSQLDCDARWECDRRGLISWIDGDNAPAVGTPIGDFVPGSSLTQAFARHGPFRDVDGGQGVCLSGVPFFSRDGRFLGYRGTLSRRSAPAATPGLLGTGASVDAFAHLAHEVRTPLTAILGFAQLIEADTGGDIGRMCRERAGSIVTGATRLRDAVDDLADAAQIERGVYTIDEGQSDVGELVDALVSRFRPVAARHGVRLVATRAGALPLAAIEPGLLSRVLDRTLSALLACAADETLALVAQSVEGRIALFVSRPVALQGLSEATLLDPASRIRCPGATAPVLGLGFGLRLASRLVESAGGSFAVEPGTIRIAIRGIAKLGTSA